MGQVNSSRNGRRTTQNLSGGDSEEARTNFNGIHNDVTNREATPAGPSGVQDAPSSSHSRIRNKSFRQSVRKSVIGLVKRGSSNHDEGHISREKKWRLSRRWSKAPVVNVDNTLSDGLEQPIPLASDEVTAERGEETATSRAGIVEENNVDGEHQAKFVSASADPDASQSPDSISKAEQSTLSHDNRMHQTLGKGLDSNEIVDVGPVNTNSATSSSGRHEVSTEAAYPSGRSENAHRRESIPIVPEAQSPDPIDPSPPLGEASESRTSEPTPIHQFAPAGTLVVVQGVVHTSDNDHLMPPRRTDRNSVLQHAEEGPVTHAPRTPRSSRHGGLLSGLLRRRNSTNSPTPRSVNDVNADSISTYSARDTSTTRDSDLNHDNRNSADESRSSQSGQSDITTSQGPSTEPTSASPSREGVVVQGDAERRQGHLSSNSMDVLGALLSVATAATAASLLSVPSARPNNPYGLPSLETASTIPQPSPTIPALARALANANPAAAAALVQRDREHEQDEHERNRVRNIWANLRERMMSGRGRNMSAPSPPTIPSVPDRNRPINDHAIPDALFGELARAFNLNSPSPHDEMMAQEPFEEQLERVASGERPPPEDNDPTPTEPEEAPPGSFERFLIDLQVDLRVALSRADNGNGETNREHSTLTADEDTRISDNEATENAIATSEGDGVAVTQPEHSVEPALLARHEAPDANSISDNSGAPEVVDTSEMTAVSETDRDVANYSRSRSATPFPTPDVESPSVAGGDIQVSETSDRLLHEQQATSENTETGRSIQQSGRGGVSWWRTYRFPPMRMAQSRPQNTNADAATSSVPADHAPPNSAAETQEVPTSNTDASTASPSSDGVEQVEALLLSQGQSINLVVPVIVVGLQSIHGNTTRRGAQPPPSPRTPSSIPPGMGNAVSITDDESPGSSSANTQQERRWQSRAARALGRLGRRPASADSAEDTRTGSERNGSRTFLIYVFGGYYPPNHHMVIGSDNLDSFEALSELAELLGQVKPPVATDVEIERSGLEIFKAKMLNEYEASSKVSSNCVDRCLICLDDYEQEDDLRLLSCKHAFHKTCVDHWLKTGRNNCPACRSKGVSTEDETLSPESTTSST